MTIRITLDLSDSEAAAALADKLERFLEAAGKDGPRPLINLRLLARSAPATVVSVERAAPEREQGDCQGGPDCQEHRTCRKSAAVAVLRVAVEGGEAFLDQYREFGDEAPLKYPYACPPGLGQPQPLPLGLLRALTAAARAAMWKDGML